MFHVFAKYFSLQALGTIIGGGIISNDEYRYLREKNL